MNGLKRLAAFSLLALLAGCDVGPKSGKGFRLPDGDPLKGRAAFVALKCTTCHKVAGLDLPAPKEGIEVVTLGGEVRTVQTYGQLVTSVINPSHSLVKRHPPEAVSENGKSKMPVFNDTMTVSQLVDLVAFLQAQYKIEDPDYLYYPYP